jgi:hypothetical protein
MPSSRTFKMQTPTKLESCLSISKGWLTGRDGRGKNRVAWVRQGSTVSGL